MFLLFVHIIWVFFYRQVCVISKDLIGVQVNNKICSHYGIAEILLKLAGLNTNQSQTKITMVNDHNMVDVQQILYL